MVEMAEEGNPAQAHSDDQHPTSPRDSKGWDGKLRVERRPVMTNPEAISDPEYSDEENILPGEQISPDEGM
jgi:protein phosphatase 1 regulatory subunit 7